MEACKKESYWQKIETFDQNCFACGSHNEYGLHMHFEAKEERLRSRIEIPSYLRGWSNLVHGGILSTLMDEIMSWTATYCFKKIVLTRGMNVLFKKPAKINSPLVVYGSVLEQKDDRNVTLRAEIFDEKNDLCSEAQGDFVLFTPEQMAKLGVIDDEQCQIIIAAMDQIKVLPLEPA